MRKVIFIISMLATMSTGAQTFAHPGILHTRESLDRIKVRVGKASASPDTAYTIFVKDPRSSYDYKVNGPYEYVSRMGARTGESGLHKKEFEDDCLAAYYNAMQWYITGNKKYAAKSISILNGYGVTLKGVINHDRELMASLCGFLLVNAAEVLRYSGAGWEQRDIETFSVMVRQVLYPVIMDFATFANGNWDAACIKVMLAFGVFLDDDAIFNKAVTYYLEGNGNGSILHYVINDVGQCQESGRDQGHTQFGLGCLAEACEVAYNQGKDLYGAYDNRLLAGFEYTAKYNLGFDVPFQEWLDGTGKYRHKIIATKDRGHFRGVYEIVVNHYLRRKGLNPFYTNLAAEKIRPEGAPWTADHPGYGTLFFRLP